MRSVLVFSFLFSLHSLFGQSSVLSEGKWFKVGITETGIYKIDRNTLDVLGVPLSIDPKKIKIYGNGTHGILPQENSEERPVDLIENSIFVSGESDGVFDLNDHILFYAVGPNKERWTSEGFEYEKNIYSDTSYYFVRIDGEDGKRIASQPSIEGTPTTTVTAFDDHITFEEDENNLISSGRGWYGEILTSGESLTFSHQIDGLNSDIDLTISAVSQSNQDASFNVFANSTSVGSLEMDDVPDGPNNIYSIKARQETGTFFISNSRSLDLRIDFDGNASGERGFLDYYYLTFKRNLSLNSNETHFRHAEDVGSFIRYEISNASNATIWNVSDVDNIFIQEASVSSSNQVFQSQSAGVEEFVVFSGDDFPAPFVFGEVANQNIRGNTSYDGIIITNPLFKTQAEQLAQFHRDHDGLNVGVVTTWEVYNEFSSGRQDVSAIRDYAKYLYEEGGNLKYLLLFGDCSYDYKDRLLNNTNLVLTYESRQSFHPIFSYSSDDYFGFFEDDEGAWEESIQGDHTMEIGIGRLPAKTVEEAQVMVDKIIYYCTSPNTLGRWRSEITYVADDEDGNIHVRHVEDLSELIDTTYAQYKINKLLLDAFNQEASGSSEISPQASSALKTRIKNGTFTINYIGHGNERLWMQEEILTKSDIQSLTNRNKLPIFVTATCEFGRYDDPIRTSGAEDLLILEQGGAIALLTTSRPVFASTNFSLNRAFHENIFREENNNNLRLGDVIRLTKNEGLEGPVNRNFTLLGDPMMMPAYPKLDIVINELEEGLDTLSALEEVTLTGEIQINEAKSEGFNGQLVVDIYDIEQNFITKGQGPANTPYTYSLRSNAIFRGNVTVENGEFSFSFVVPKNISYQFQKGKMSLYAWDKANNLDAGGSSREFLIGGTSDTPTEDTTPPNISMVLNDDTFQSGDIVGDSPLLIADISDDSGITTASAGIVQGITLTLGEEVFNLNDFYTSNVDDYTSGKVVFPIQDLNPGRYDATLKVWDTHNNSSESSISFVVSDEDILFVYNPTVYPNPIEGSTTFSFEHDREDEDLLVRILVYSSQGEIVSSETFNLNNSNRLVEIPWNATTNSGQALFQGLYFSRIIIQSRLDGAIKEISQKLVIVN